MIKAIANILRRNQGLTGGIFLPGGGGPVGTPFVRALPLPARLTAPLRCPGMSAAVPLVQPGDRVEAGQLIGRAASADALNVYAPASGRVTALTTADSARDSAVPAVQIETSPQAAHPELAFEHPAQPPADLSPSLADLIQAAEFAGLHDFQREPASLAVLLRTAADRKLRHLIVNMLPGEPAGLPPLPTTNEELTTIVRLAHWVGNALAVKRIWITADAADSRTLKRLRATARSVSSLPRSSTEAANEADAASSKVTRPARKTPVRVAGLVNKYPQHHPVLLAYSLLEIETPPGAGTIDAGVLVLQSEAVVHLAAALSWPGHEPVPMTHRLVAVAGSALAQPGRYWVPIGTSFSDLLNRVGLAHTPRRVVDGGPLTGRAVARLDPVTTAQTSIVLAIDRAADRTPAPGPCIRCGWCQEDCPVGLDPRMLLNFAELGQPSQAAPFFPQACIECGVCSYICPADLPLADAAAALKRALLDNNAPTAP